MKKVFILFAIASALFVVGCAHHEQPVSPPQPAPEKVLDDNAHQMCVTYNDGLMCVRYFTASNGENKVELIQKSSPKK